MTLQDIIVEGEKAFDEIKKGRQNSKYHRNYIATHVVESFLRSQQITLLEGVCETLEGMKTTGVGEWDSGHNDALKAAQTLITKAIEQLQD